jgi:outer membrane protein OmpA-like peptidoglycan-associated protein
MRFHASWRTFMSFESGLPKMLVRFATIALVAVGASACSSVPSWVDPTTWMGGDDQTADSSGDQGNATAQDLASIPDKPAPPSTVDERKQVADTLKADRADAQYSGDALRGGTEPSAAPPSNAPVAEASLSSTAATTPAAQPEPAAPSVPADSAGPATPVPASVSQPAQNAQAVSPANVAPAATPAEPATPAAQVASAPADAISPAAPASDDQLGFQPSKAPPLDPSVAHFVPRAVIDQIQTPSNGAAAAGAPALTPPPQPAPAQTTSSIDPSTDSPVRHASFQTASANMPSVKPSFTGMVRPAAFTAGQQSAPSAIVFFPHDAAVLGAKAKAQILTTAQAFGSGTGSGFVHVVGHSSSRTGDMPLARHLEVVFEHSQDFATAVANELIRDGVPADKVLIEAVGDSQPVYYESMPQGEAGNRRAEIFL